MRTAWSAVTRARDLSRACVFLTARRVPSLSESPYRTRAVACLSELIRATCLPHMSLCGSRGPSQGPHRWPRRSFERADESGTPRNEQCTENHDPSSRVPVGRLVCYTWQPGFLNAHSVEIRTCMWSYLHSTKDMRTAWSAATPVVCCDHIVHKWKSRLPFSNS